MKGNIKHVWFDIEGTIAPRTKEFNKEHDELRYITYSKAVNKPLDEGLKNEYEALYKKFASNSAVFRSLGLPSDYWQNVFGRLDETKFYSPDKNIYLTLEKLKKIVPLSLFTNFKQEMVHRSLAALQISPEWFTYIINGDDIPERKPALDGFYAMIEKSKLPPNQILYVGDRVGVDILPAKEVGMQTCLVWSTSPEANYSFNNFQDILSIFQ